MAFGKAALQASVCTILTLLLFPYLLEIPWQPCLWLRWFFLPYRES